MSAASESMPIWLSIVIMAGGSAVLLWLVGLALGRFSRAPTDSVLAQREELLERIEDCLPRTQCAQCGYPGCRPYAEAVLDGQTGIDQCPPGGQRTIERLSTLLGREAEDTLPSAPIPQVAVIDEANCIGCALCLPACPSDAIVGAHRFMHTVIARDCTGCELCLAPCPVDCIELVALADTPERIGWSATA